MECAAVILVLGFSVDYCVHISHGYMNAPVKKSRQHRVQFALLQNAHAIVSSAFVSILATMPILIDSENTIYQKLGLLTALTIVSSVAFSFTSFALILSTVAPQGTTGRLLFCKQCDFMGGYDGATSGRQDEGPRKELVM